MGDLTGVFDAMCAVDVGALDHAGLARWEADAARLRSRLDAFDVSCARQRGHLGPWLRDAGSVDGDSASGPRISARAAQTTSRRAELLDAMPMLERALVSGRVTAEHVDAVARAARSLGDDAEALIAQEEWLTDVAASSTPDSFSRVVTRQTRRLRQDGSSRLEQQRRDTYLRHWIHPETGMVCVRGEFDPERGAQLIGRLESQVEAMFHGSAARDRPSARPTQDALRAMALITLTGGDGIEDGVDGVDTGGSARRTSRGSSAGHTELSVVVDLQTLRTGLHDLSILHNSQGVDLPIEVIRRLACEAWIIPMVMNSASVVLDVGRRQRLATPDQRRALQAMYTTCAFPGCNVPFKHTVPHHIDPWSAGGSTDLANQLPVCPPHHRCVHEGGWRVSMHATTRALTFVSPEGVIHTTGPPNPHC